MKKFLKGLLILVAAVAIFVLICALLPKPQNFNLANPMLKDSPDSLPILIAHGGGNREFPDNTLEAFYNAYSVDPRVMMETDVTITKDGVVILSHDVRLDRKTNVTGEIADWNYADLIAQKVDFGYTNETKSQKRVEGSALRKFTTDDGKTVTPLDVTYPDGVTPRHETVFLATTLEELDQAFEAFFDAQAERTIVFGDRFPLRYFAEEYDLDYYAAFPGCGTQTEPSAATIAFLTEKVRQEQIPAVWYIEFSNHQVADSIAEATGAKTAMFHTCHNVTQEELDGGATYLSLMTENLETLRQNFAG